MTVELTNSCNRLGADVRIAHQGPMPTDTASLMRPDTRRQSYLDVIEQSACKRGGVVCRSNAERSARSRSRSMKSYTGDGGFVALRGLPAGVGLKPPRAALVEDRCREHRGKSRAMSTAGMDREGEQP